MWLLGVTQLCVFAHKIKSTDKINGWFIDCLLEYVRAGA